jgi:hypothetical protein
MANVNNPHGFRPLNRSLSGGPGAALMRCHKLVGYGTALFIGDAVTRVASGLQPFPAISAAITPGTTPVFGVNLVHGAASTATTNHLVIPAGNQQIFEVQDDNDTDGVAAADINKNANINLAAGSATTQISAHQLDESSIATTNTLDMHILGLLQAPDNAFGSNARVMIVFNNNQLGNQVAGI